MKCAMKKQKVAPKSLQSAARGVSKSFEDLGTAITESVGAINFLGPAWIRLRYRIPRHIPDEQVKRYVKERIRKLERETKCRT